MKKLAIEISDILEDYLYHLDVNISVDHVLEWVEQFDEDDREFILQEFLHIIKKTYVSEDSAKDFLLEHIKKLTKKYGFKTVDEFLKNAVLLQLQEKDKSQSHLLSLLETELYKKYDFDIKDCGTESQTHYIYLDDIIATGRTLHDTLFDWLNNNKKILKRILSKEITLDICVFCCHNWNSALFRLSYDLHQTELLNLINIHSNYSIVNIPTWDKQDYNLAYPINPNDTSVDEYIEELKTRTDAKRGQYIFRDVKQPKKEILFSSSENRNRFERIILLKGIEILDMVENLNTNHRPLGATYPSYRTLGTGTLFFTWRNISNTCPVVFWWKVHWKPLFPLYNRGE